MDNTTPDAGILKIKGADGEPPPKPEFRDADGNTVGTSGGPRIRVPEALGQALLAASPEDRAELARKILAHRAKQRAAKKSKAAAKAGRKASRRAKNKAARKQRRR